MDDLVKCQAAPAQSQISTLEEILFLLRDLIDSTPMIVSGESYEETYVYNMACMAARLTFLYWINEDEDEAEETREQLDDLYVDLLHKTLMSNKFCFGVFKAPKLRHPDTLIFGEFVSRFVDVFMENLLLILKESFPMLREGLILLITFLADPPENNIIDYSDLYFFQAKIHAVLDLASHTNNIFSETSMDLARGKTAVVDLQKSIDEVRGEIERLCVPILHPSWSNFPMTNGFGHFESLLVYLNNLTVAMHENKKVVPFLKHRILTINEELLHLRPHIHYIWKIQNKHEEVKVVWEKIINLSYQTDLEIKLSFFIDHPIWYNLICLSFIVDKIKDLKSKVMRIKDSHLCKSPPASVHVFKTPTSTSTIEDVVGFKHETEVVIDRLTRGTSKVDIVPIVGMAGIGKTTFVKKLFNEPSIKYHFHKRAFCTVSQDYIKKNVLLDILSDLCKIDDEEMSDDDLADMLRKCLCGCKYLIVMDDMWDIDAWYDMRTSFPDNNNGSRVIFTTRITNICLIAKADSNPFRLPFFSIDESWALLKLKIFHKNPCPPHLCKVGKLIAEKCQGLPLAIVVIAGVLTKTERSLSHWTGVADAYTSFASSEGCKDVIILSYKKLPEALKSCFLYLGAFHEDQKIEAKMLTKLWIAEGFILKSPRNLCLRKVAKQYLNELGDRNLLTVTKRSCNGEIKHFHVHDLIRDFCRTEAQEQHYLCIINSHPSKLSMTSVYNQYRVCIQDEWRSFVDSEPRGLGVHSLLHYSKHYHEEKSLESFLCNFKLVQVLDLRMTNIVGSFPAAVTTLVHLRYLALRLEILLTVKVPCQISNLWNLETLLLLGEMGFLTVQFPNDIWKLKRLKHVEAMDGAHVAVDDDVSGVDSQLLDLDTFTSLVIPPGKDGEELLTRLPHVRKLSCRFNGCNQLPKLDILTKLESLQMRDIGNGFSGYPYTFTFPISIRKLTLESFKVRWNEFTDVIRKLPILQILVVRWTKSYDDANAWDVQDEEFPNIISVTLEYLDIQEWKASTDSFPCLEELNLSSCRRLIKIPPGFGEIPTFKSISINFCNEEVAHSAIQIQKDQLEMGNESLEFQIHLK